VVDSENDETINVAHYLSNQLTAATGYSLEVLSLSEKNAGKNSIIFSDKISDTSLGTEGYTLESDKDKIILRGTSNGLFYAVQTLFQLLPVDIYSSEKVPHVEWKVPAVEIKDKPRYKWRGMHLDVSRYFFDKGFIKRYLDYMAMHKLNRFHWHLTDNQGWRVQIDKYPNLTRVGAYRETSRINGIRNVIGKYDGIPYGGYYTKDDIREIVAYAKSRFIEVIPEIEMPGHSIAALASYTEVSCTGLTFDVKKSYDTFNAGKPFKVAVDWRSYPDDFCAGKELTFEFLQNVLTEVMEMFPSKYIHIGGDECRKVHWKTCPDCQARIKSENLKNVEELQSYFIKRIERFVNSKGRKIIGWDEILEGGIPPEATVMSWRGEAGGIEAAKQGHDVIMTPTSYCYFDHWQGEPDFEPNAIGGYLPLKKVYAFDPTPKGLTPDEAKHIIGGQANMWTEYFSTPSEVEYMVFPRIAALAEAVWSPARSRNWNDFCRRMDKQYQRYNIMGINYAKSALNAYPYSVKTDDTDNALLISFRTQIKKPIAICKIRYTLDGSAPNSRSALFTEPFKLDRSATIKAGIFRNDTLAGTIIGRKFIVHKAVNKPVEFIYPPDTTKTLIDNYDDLTNGMTGTGSVGGTKGYKDIFNNGFWAQFEGDDFYAIVDLQKATEINKIAINFLQFTGAKSFMPLWVEFAVSQYGQDYQILGKIMNDIPEKENDPTVKTFEYRSDTLIKARYIRIIARNRAVVPDWHTRNAGRKAWLFADEIIID